MKCLCLCASFHVAAKAQSIQVMAKLQGLHGLRLATHGPVVCQYRLRQGKTGVELLDLENRMQYCSDVALRCAPYSANGGTFERTSTSASCSASSGQTKGCVGAWSCPEFMPDARTGSKDAVSTLRAKRLEAGTLGINFVRLAPPSERQIAQQVLRRDFGPAFVDLLPLETGDTRHRVISLFGSEGMLSAGGWNPAASSENVLGSTEGNTPGYRCHCIKSARPPLACTAEPGSQLQQLASKRRHLLYSRSW